MLELEVLGMRFKFLDAGIGVAFERLRVAADRKLTSLER